MDALPHSPREEEIPSQSPSFSATAALLFAIRIAAFARIRSTLPVSPGTENFGECNSFAKFRSPFTTQGENVDSIGKGKQKQIIIEPVLSGPAGGDALSSSKILATDAGQQPPGAHFAGPSIAGECSETDISIPLESVVLKSNVEGFRTGSNTQTRPTLRRRGKKSLSFPDDEACHGSTAVPVSRNQLEQEAREHEYLQKRRKFENIRNAKVSGKVVGLPSFYAVTRESKQESQISSESSVPGDLHINKGMSPLTGSQLGKRTSFCSAGYDSDQDGHVEDMEGEVPSEKRDDTGGLREDVEVDTQTEGRVGLDSDEGEMDGAPVYRMPEEKSEQQSNFLLWPAGWAIEALGFQVRLMVQGLLLVGSLFNWCYSFAANRVHETLEAKDKATEAVSQRITMISRVPPKVTEGGSIALRKAGWGCLAAIYVCLLLSMLWFPAFLFDFIFVSKLVEEPVNIREPLHFDYTQPHPSAVFVLRPSHLAGSSRGKLAIPISHRVHVTVVLTLPVSDYNRNLGMFQLTAELLSENDEVIKLSSRPCMLRFQSAPIRLVKTIIVSLPSLLGVFSESQTLVVHLMEFEEQHIPTSSVRILLQPKAGLPLGAGIPELYSAELLIESRLPWLKDLVRNWKWTVYIWSGLALYILEIAMVLCCCRHALLPKTWVGRSEEDSYERGSDGNFTSSEAGKDGLHEDRASRRHNQGRRRVSIEEQIPTARVASTGSYRGVVIDPLNGNSEKLSAGQISKTSRRERQSRQQVNEGSSRSVTVEVHNKKVYSQEQQESSKRDSCVPPLEEAF